MEYGDIDPFIPFFPIPVAGFPGFDLGWFSTSGFGPPRSNQPPSWERPRYPLIRNGCEELTKLGQGAQGSVFLARSLRTHKLYAVKETHQYNTRYGEPTEVVIVKNIIRQHRSIIQLRDYHFEPDNRLLMYYDFCAGGDLETLMKRVDFISEAWMWGLFLQLADAIAFLHYGYNRKAQHPNNPPHGWQKIVHGDIKPGNVFIKEPVSGGACPKIALGDFGSATLKPITYGFFMTDLRYQGPEQTGPPHLRQMSAMNDVWSVGAVMHELGHGLPPIAQIPFDCDPRQWLQNPRTRDPRPLSRDYSRRLSNNMMDTLELDPEDRVRSRQLVGHLVKEFPHH